MPYAGGESDTETTHAKSNLPRPFTEGAGQARLYKATKQHFISFPCFCTPFTSFILKITAYYLLGGSATIKARKYLLDSATSVSETT